MRDILFRGKRVGDGKWVYGNLIQAPGYCCILEREEDLHPMDAPYLDGEIGWVDGKATPVIPETVGQYTGLLDKNGKEIFEGDVVLGKDQLVRELEIRGYIGHQNGSFVIVGDFMTHYRWLDYDVEIIGNIHDNPELLEEE